MYYKVKGVSAKSGKGTVYVVYRQTGINAFETAKSTGVTINPKDFDTTTGKVKTRVPEYPELNAKIRQVTADLEFAVRNAQAGAQHEGIELTKEILDKAQEHVVGWKIGVEQVSESFFADETEIEKLEKELERRRSDLQQKRRIVERISGVESATPLKPVILFTDKIAEFLVARSSYRPATAEGYQDLSRVLKKFRPAWS